MLAELFKEVRHLSGATEAKFKRRLSLSEQYFVGEQIATGLNDLFLQVYGEEPIPGERSYPNKESDGIRVYATISGARTQCRIRDTDVMVHIDHLPINMNENPVAQSVWNIISGAKTSEK